MSGSTSNLGLIVAFGGFVLAFVFGAVANRTNFCTMGAVSDVVNMGSWGRMRMWLLAIAVAILGTHALQLAGLIDLTKSIYVRPNVTWASYLLGGFLFGGNREWGRQSLRNTQSFSLIYFRLALDSKARKWNYLQPRDGDGSPRHFTGAVGAHFNPPEGFVNLLEGVCSLR